MRASSLFDDAHLLCVDVDRSSVELRRYLPFAVFVLTELDSELSTVLGIDRLCVPAHSLDIAAEGIRELDLDELELRVIAAKPGFGVFADFRRDNG